MTAHKHNDVNCLLLDVTGPDSVDSGHQFRVEITEVVLTRVGEPPINWVIESWHPERGLARRERR